MDRKYVARRSPGVLPGPHRSGRQRPGAGAAPRHAGVLRGGLDDEEIMAPVLRELRESCPDEFRLEAVKDREQRIAEVEEEKSRTGAYRL
jgi:hypothetical protein